jgi:hypothetical protein
MSMPGDTERLWNEALAHFEARQHSAAESCCQRAIALAPGRPLPHALLAHLFHLRGLLRPSKFHAFEACRSAAGSHWRDVLWLSTTMLKIDEPQLAREVLALVDPHDPAHREGLAEIAVQFSALGDEASARYFQGLAESAAARNRPLKVPVHS